MNNDEVKFILQAYRPEGQDAEDPCFKQALETVNKDSVLREWFNNEMEMDRTTSSKLMELKPPQNLKRSILAGQHVSAISGRYQVLQKLALAASLVLLIGLSSLWFSPRSNYDHTAYMHDMADFLSHKLNQLDVYSDDLLKIQHYFKESGLNEDFVLPAGLHSLPGIGCRILEWQGQKVALICFRQEDQKVVHLLVMDRKVFPKFTETPEFDKVEEWTMATWNRESKHYLLAGGPGLSHRL